MTGVVPSQRSTLALNYNSRLIHTHVHKLEHTNFVLSFCTLAAVFFLQDICLFTPVLSFPEAVTS